MEISRDYILGLVDGEGSFSFTTNNSGGTRWRIPAFQLRMHARDTELIGLVKNFLGLRDRVYTYSYRTKPRDKVRRGPFSTILVRDVGQLKNIIIPFFYGRLIGYKSEQFNAWLETIGNDPLVPEEYKILFTLHKNGYYQRVTNG